MLLRLSEILEIRMIDQFDRRWPKIRVEVEHLFEKLKQLWLSCVKLTQSANI